MTKQQNHVEVTEPQKVIFKGLHQKDSKSLSCKDSLASWSCMGSFKPIHLRDFQVSESQRHSSHWLQRALIYKRRKQHDQSPNPPYYSLWLARCPLPILHTHAQSRESLHGCVRVSFARQENPFNCGLRVFFSQLDLLAGLHISIQN